MYCKHCGAKLEPEQKTCSGCGTPVEEKKAFVMSKGLKITISVILCVALVLGLAYTVFLGAGGTWEDITDFFVGLFTDKENNIFYKESYTADESKLDKTASQVVATLGNMSLTNSQLQVYYWEGVYNVASQLGDYALYYGLDFTKPLDEQVYNADTGLTWQQMILEESLNAWTKHALIVQEAEKNGFVLSEEYQQDLDNIEQELAAAAAQYGYASAEAMLQADYGKGVTVADYKNYIRLSQISNQYLMYLNEKTEVTMEEIENWYAENTYSLEYYGIDKESGNMTDVRHLLVSIEQVAGEKKTEYSAAEWEACRQKAQSLLDQWLAGDQTEVSFEVLITKHSDDTASVPYGGLIDGVFKNSGYVEEFEDWCADTTREKGHYGLVKTSYGYHLMYCVETEPAWIRASRESILYARETALWDGYVGTADINYKAIAIAAISLTAS